MNDSGDGTKDVRLNTERSVHAPGAEKSAPPPLPKVNALVATEPLNWLKLGWKDLVETRFRGLFYGLFFVLMGYAIVWIYATKWQLTMGLIGGFFLMGPFLCTGLYDLSRQYERTGSASLISSIKCWTTESWKYRLFCVNTDLCHDCLGKGVINTVCIIIKH